MSFQGYTLSSATNQIKAHLAGRHLLCSFKPLSGRAIPPGKYKLSAPMKNVIYGPFVLLSPVSRSSAPRDWIDIYSRSQGLGRAGIQSTQWIDNPAIDWIDNPSIAWIENAAPCFNQQGIFVLVGKPLAGRNAILITWGFADFISALAQTGGSEITVS